MCSRNLLFRDVSFIRRYLLFTPRLLGPIPGASYSLSCVLFLLPSTMHRVIAHQPIDQPLPCRCPALPARSRSRRSSVGAGRNPTRWYRVDSVEWRTPTPGPLCLLLVHQRGREALKLARSNELTSELYLCVHNYKNMYCRRAWISQDTIFEEN